MVETVPAGAGAETAPALRSYFLQTGVGGAGVHVDFLAADLLGDLALLGVDVLVETDALLGHDALLDDGLLGAQRDLVLLLGELGAVERVVDVALGDRLALDPDLLALPRHGLGDRVGDDVLSQARAADLAGRRPDADLLPGI